MTLSSDGELKVKNLTMATDGSSSLITGMTAGTTLTAGRYALAASTGGSTLLNSAASQALQLRQNNMSKLALNTAGDEWTSSVDFTVDSSKNICVGTVAEGRAVFKRDQLVEQETLMELVYISMTSVVAFHGESGEIQ